MLMDFIKDFNKLFYDYNLFISVSLIAALFVMIIVIFSIFTNKILKDAILERNEIHKVMFKGIKQLMAMSEDTFFGMNISEGSIIYSDNMEPRFGWHFPKKLSKSDREDLTRIWQVYDEDADLLRKMYTDVYHDGKNAIESLRLLDKNRNYVSFQLELRPVMNKRNKVIYVVGNIKHD